MFQISIFLVACWISSSRAAWPPMITSCPASSDLDKYNQCALGMLQDLVPLLPLGIPTADIPPLEPFYYPSLQVDYSLPSFDIKANMSNISITGVTNFKLHDFYADPHNMSLYIKVQMPFVNSKAFYDVEGYLLFIPVTSMGHFNGNFSDTMVEAQVLGREVKDEKNVTRVDLSKVRIKLLVNDGKIKLNSPPDYQDVAEAITGLFDKYPKLVLDLATPLFEANIETMAQSMLQGVLHTFTKNELIPDIITTTRN